MENLKDEVSKFLDDNNLSIDNLADPYSREELLKDTIFEDMIEVRSARIGDDFDTQVITYYLPKINRYLEFSGYYSSWDGSELDDYYEVSKTVKMVEITEYNEI